MEEDAIEQLRGSFDALAALLFALIRTHPSPAALRAAFTMESERLLAGELAMSPSEARRDAAEHVVNALHGLLRDMQGSSTETGSAR